MTYTYDKNTDYQNEINKAVNGGNYMLAAVLEQQRNSKIDGENMTNYAKTDYYSSYLNAPNAYDSYLKEQRATLDSARAAQERAAQSALNSQISELQAQKPEIERSAGKAAQSAYVQNEMAKKNMPQMLKGVGKTGGLAESAAVALQSNYENVQGGIYDSMNSALRAVDSDIARAKSGSQVSIDSNYAKYLSELNSLLKDAARYSYSDGSDALSAMKRDEETRYNRNLEVAKTLARIGDFSGYAALGYSRDQIKALESYYMNNLR